MMVVVELSKEFGDARNLVLGFALILFVVVLPRGLAQSAMLLKGIRNSKLRTRPGTKNAS